MGEDVLSNPLDRAAGGIASLFSEMYAIQTALGAQESQAISPEKVTQWYQALSQKREALQKNLGDFQEQVNLHYQQTGELPDISPEIDIMPGSPLSSFVLGSSDLPTRLQALCHDMEEKLSRTEQSVTEFAQILQNDRNLITQAQAFTFQGNYDQAMKIMANASRRFKNIDYWQPDRQANRQSGALESLSKEYREKRQYIEEQLTQLNTLSKKWQSKKGFLPLRKKINQLNESMERTQQICPEALSNSTFGSRFLELKNHIQQWQQETLVDISQLEHANLHFLRWTRLSALGALGGGLLLILLVLWGNTGYRIIGPDGKKQIRRFLLPYDREITFELPYYEPLTLSVPIHFGRFHDMKQITKDKMTRTSGNLEIATSPSQAHFTLRGLDEHVLDIQKQGKSPQQLKELPSGRYELLLTLGNFHTKQTVEIHPHQDNPIAVNLPVGNAEITSAPEGVEVFQKSQSLGKTPLTLQGYSPGDYSFTLSFDGVTAPALLEIKASQTARFHYSFGFGKLDIQSDPPGAEVLFLDSSLPSGETPYPLEKVLAKTYSIELRYPQLTPQKHSVQVAPQKITTTSITFDYADITLDADPREGTFVQLEEKKEPAYQGPPPLKLPPLAPGNYTLVLTSSAGETIRQPFTVTAGERNKTIQASFPTGSILLTSSPTDAIVSIPELKIVNQRTPIEIPKAVTGDYLALFSLKNNVIRKHFTVEENKPSQVQANFLDISLKERTDLPPYEEHNFLKNRIIQPGQGLKKAKIQAPIELTLQAFGKPDSIRHIPDLQRGLRYILKYEKMGLTLTSDGNVIELLQFSLPSPLDPNRTRFRPYWAHTDKNISLGDSEAKVFKAYGTLEDSRDKRKAEYPGITFFFSATPQGQIVSSILITPLLEKSDSLAPFSDPELDPLPKK